MKHFYSHLFLVIALFAGAALSANAFDFQDGDIVYLINDDGTTATVTYMVKQNKENYTGITEINIPEKATDPATGKVYRRELPIEYYENANFLRLRGENMDGSIAQLVFLSARGIERVKDLTGKGPDHDRCGGHTH